MLSNVRVHHRIPKANENHRPGMPVGTSRSVGMRPLLSHFSPLSLLLLITASVFLVEMAYMFLLEGAEQLPVTQRAFLSSVMLIISVFPALYWLMLRPASSDLVRGVRTEEELRRTCTELEVKLREQTRQMAEAREMFKKQTEQQQTQDAHRERLEFISSVTHDIRTPLTAITGYAQALHRDLLKNNTDRRSLKHVESVIAAAKRLNSVVQDMVDTTLLEAKQMEMNIEPVLLQSIIGQLQQRTWPAMDLDRLRIHAAADLPPVLADTVRLERIILNLVNNALKYSPQDTVVTLEAKASGRKLIVSVSDHGVGIGASDLPHVFSGLAKLGEATKAGGLGMGLHMAKMMVEAMGGRIWVESKPGRGSTFYFTLPLA